MNKMFDLTGRLALVTGSSRGIGRAIAEGYVEAGARVIINGRDAAAVDAAVKADRQECHCGAVRCDRPRRRSRPQSRRSRRTVGPIDILVNNAGMQKRAPIVDFPEADWRQMMATNLDSVFFVTQAVARGMIERQRGKIVNICSVMSEIARPTIPAYTASKGAVKMLTKAMCAEFAKYGITANGISPGYFGTELNTALMNDEKFFRLGVRAHACRALGQGRGAAGCGDFPRQRCVVVRERAHPVRRRRHDGGGVSCFPSPRLRGEGARAISAFTRVCDALWRGRMKGRFGTAPHPAQCFALATLSPFSRGEGKEASYAFGPIVTATLPTPSTSHSSLCPGCSALTPAGVPVMMMSPAASSTISESFQMISGTFQIICSRSPSCFTSPFTFR